MAKHSKADGVVCRNRRAAHRFHILDTFECGIVLVGSEVKSLRDRSASLNEAYAAIERGELWLIGSHIGLYRHAPSASHEPLRRRKLLLHANELRRLRPKIEQKGMTLIPLDIHFNDRGIAKVTLALVVGKRQHDKREDLKARQDRRDMARAMRRR